MSAIWGCACLGFYLVTWLVGAAYAALRPRSDVLHAEYGHKRPVHYLFYFTNLTNVALGFASFYTLLLPLRSTFDMLVLASVWGAAKDVAYWVFDRSGPRGWGDPHAWDSVNKHVCSGYIVASLACFVAEKPSLCTHVTPSRVMYMGMCIGAGQIFSGTLFWLQMHRETQGQGAHFRYAIVSGPLLFGVLWIVVGPLLIGSIGWAALVALRAAGVPSCPHA